MNIVYIEYICY